MKQEGSKSHLRCDLPAVKFVCPKTKWKYDKLTKRSKRICHCENPCTEPSCDRMFYLYPEKNLHAYPGTLRDTKEWDSTYKICVNVEKSINHFRYSFCVAMNTPRLFVFYPITLAPNCMKESLAILKNCFPNGIPTIVMHQIQPTIRFPSAISQPKNIIHIRFTRNENMPVRPVSLQI